MRRLVFFVALFNASLLAAPLEEDSSGLVRHEHEQTENGYRFSYETKDGQKREEVGTIEAPSGVLKVSGWYSFRAPDGATYRVDFVADENGYRTTEQPVVVAPQLLPVPVVAGALSNAALLSLVG